MVPNPVPGDLPTYKAQFQPWSNTPVCNYQVLLQILISWFGWVWSWTMQMGRSPGTGLGTTDLEDSRVFLRWTTSAFWRVCMWRTELKLSVCSECRSLTIPHSVVCISQWKAWLRSPCSSFWSEALRPSCSRIRSPEAASELESVERCRYEELHTQTGMILHIVCYSRILPAGWSTLWHRIQQGYLEMQWNRIGLWELMQFCGEISRTEGSDELLGSLRPQLV